MAKNNGTPAWVWVGCGCGLCILLILGGIVAAGLAGFSFLNRAADKMADPAARAEAVAEILGAENGLPPGYHAHATFSFPFAFKLASLGDGPEPPSAEGAGFEERIESIANMFPRADELGQHTFIFLETRSMRENQRIEDVLDGEPVGGTTNIDLNLEFDIEEPLGEGSVEAAGTNVDWRAARGKIGMLSGVVDAQWVALRFRCDDERKRDAVWVEHPPTDVPLADTEKLTSFLNHFSPCP